MSSFSTSSALRGKGIGRSAAYVPAAAVARTAAAAPSVAPSGWISGCPRSACQATRAKTAA
ncbi:hypothetical protein ACWEQP_04445 [Streptomyces sp. NPDC004044]